MAVLQKEIVGDKAVTEVLDLLPDGVLAAAGQVQRRAGAAQRKVEAALTGLGGEVVGREARPGPGVLVPGEDAPQGTSGGCG